MQKTILIGMCAVFLSGCATRSPMARLTGREYSALVTAANSYAMAGPPIPEPIERLKPLKVYGHMANIVIALRSSAHEERGYYVFTLISSYIPRSDQEWTLIPIDVPEVRLGQVYEYRRKK